MDGLAYQARLSGEDKGGKRGRRTWRELLSNAMIFSCLMLGQPWPTLGLLLCVRHSGITSLLLFAHLFSLLPFPHLSLSLALSLTFFLELKCTESACLAYTVRSAI